MYYSSGIHLSLGSQLLISVLQYMHMNPQVFTMTLWPDYDTAGSEEYICLCVHLHEGKVQLGDEGDMCYYLGINYLVM